MTGVHGVQSKGERVVKAERVAGHVICLERGNLLVSQRQLGDSGKNKRGQMQVTKEERSNTEKKRGEPTGSNCSNNGARAREFV
jgi:hypothetical protein